MKKLSLTQLKFHPGQQIRTMHVIRMFNKIDLTKKSIFDAGCGSGEYMFWIGTRYPSARIDGVEYNPHKISDGQRNIRTSKLKNIRLWQGDLTVQFGSNLYDLLYSIDVLEHIDDDLIAIRNMWLALKERGLLLIHVPLVNRRYWFRCLMDRNFYGKQYDHVRDGYDEKDIIDKLTKKGFTVLEKHYTFGWAGTLAWELFNIFRESNKWLYVPLRLVILLLCRIEFFSRKKRGNGVLILAEK